MLILGASGLVGGRLTRHLREQGMEIRAGTRRQGYRPAAACEVGLLAWDRPDLLEILCAGVDAVVHLASPNAANISANPALLPELLAGNRRLIQAMRATGVSRLVYLSSIHAHGSELSGRIDENSPRSPTHPYGNLHCKMEDLLASSGLSTVILRSVNGVGWPVDMAADCWSLLANDLCRQAARDGSVNLKGGPGTRRDFLALEEILCALAFALARRLHGVFLVASGTTRTTGWLAQKVAEEYFHQTGKSLVGVPPKAPEPVGPEFMFAPDKLAQAGLRLRDRLQPEISRLLELCLGKEASAKSPARVSLQAESLS